MPSPWCPGTGCERQVVHTDKGMAVTLLNAHIATHTSDASRKQGSGPSESEKLPTPKITQSRRVESWSPSQTTWKPYKIGTGIPKEECGTQPTDCGDSDPLEQLSRAYPNTAVKPNAGQAESTRRRAAIPVAKDARRSEELNTSQGPGKLPRMPPAKAQDKAATHERRVRCVQEHCRRGGDPANPVNTTGQHVPGKGPADTDTRKMGPSGKLRDDYFPTDATATMEQKEGARDAVKGEAAPIKSGYKKQQTPINSVGEVRLQEKSKCESCVVPTNQQLRVRPRQVREHKPFRKRWKSTPQKQDKKNPKAEMNKDEAAKTEEAPTALVPGSWLALRQSAGAIKGRNRPRQRGQHTWNVKASASGNIRIAPKQAKDRAPVVLNHHIFDPKSGRGKGTARKQPAPRL